MEPPKKYQPNIEPDIRPDLQVVHVGGQSSAERDNPEVAKQLGDSENQAGSSKFGVANSGGESTPERANLDTVKDAETSNNGYWAGKSRTSEEPRSTRRKITGKLTGRKAATGGLIGLIIGIPTIISIMLSPALVIQQFAETLTKEFNDQLTSIDMRSTYLLKKKYHSTFTKGVCSPVTIRCKYQSIREKSGLAKRLNNAGVTIEGDKSAIPGRVKPTHFVYEGKRIPASKLVAEAKINPGLRRALRKGYDPLYAAFSDRKSGDIRTRVGLKKSSNVSSNPDEMEDDLKKTAAGTDDIPEDGQKLKEIKDQDGKVTGYEDSSGTYYTPERGATINSLIDEINGRKELADAVGKAATKSFLKGALTATAFGAGAVDSTCTVWNMIRLAGFAAKIYQQRQLIRYGYEFVKFAHKIKYGDAKTDEANFFLSKLTANPNSEGKNALDSQGYRWAAYGDNFTPGDFSTTVTDMKPGDDSTKYLDKLMLQNEASRYVNGQLVSTSIMAKIAGFIAGGDSNTVEAADNACHFVKSWKGQAIVFGLAAAGAVVAFFTGGASITVGATAQVIASAALGVAFSLIQPKLMDMAKGEVIQGDENSNEVGNAAVSGLGGYNAETAQGRGLGVATQETYTAYSQLSSQVAAKYAKEDRDSRSPFDPTSSNTFIGGILASFTPYLAKTNTVGVASLSLASFVTSNLSTFGMTQPTIAASDKYNKCDDPEYDKYNLAADPFCNLRYAVPVDDLKIDSETVLDYMLSSYTLVFDEAGKPVIDPATGEQQKIYNWIESPSDPTPKGDYADYVKKCFTRQNSIGDELTDPSEGSGEECIIGKGGANEERNKMFRLFYIDTSVEDGMDEDFETNETTTSDNLTGGTFRVATFNILHPSDNLPGCLVLCRLDRTTSTLKNNQIDIVGFQEMRGEQQKAFHNSGSQGYGADVYDTYPSKYTNGNDPDENVETVVGWNKAKFELVSAHQKGVKYEGNRKVNIVKLRYIENGASGPEFYVLNTHDPVDKRADSEGGPADRKYNNELYYNMIKNDLTDAPVIMTGDFNSKMTVEASRNKPLGGKRENLAYCILTRNNLLIHVSDAQQGKSGDCPSEKDAAGGNRVDHIFISPTMKATNYTVLNKHANGSDHDTVYSDVQIPGASDSFNLSSDYSTPSFAKNPAVEVDEPNTTKCSGGLTIGAQSLREVILSKWPAIKDIGGYACRANTANPSELSVHAVGRALDIMTDANTPAGLKTGDEIRNFLITNAEPLGVQRVIWNHHIWSANIDGWRAYTGPDPHTSHVHAEINLEASRNPKLGN